MKSILLVSNGHGEEAIAARIAQEIQGICAVQCDHLALVGEFGHPSSMHAVGPRRKMPSGGLIAMGNVKNFVADVRGGLLGHTLAQLRFLHSVRNRYDAVVAVGDIFAFLMAKQARGAKTVFVGTAKSVYVAPYGAFEERLLRTADAVFVRDEPTAARLQSHGVQAIAANVIVDLFSHSTGSLPACEERLAIFPGSRQAAYEDAVFLCAVVREIARGDARIGATLSIAPGLEAQRFSEVLRDDGWDVHPGNAPQIPFELSDRGKTIIHAWEGEPGAMLQGAAVVLGQAGTANEAAAAHGIPVVAFERPGRRQHGWYRMRQRGLLGAALAVFGGDVQQAADALQKLLDDASLRTAMGAVGRQRMGPAGGSRLIAGGLARLVQC